MSNIDASGVPGARARIVGSVAVRHVRGRSQAHGPLSTTYLRRKGQEKMASYSEILSDALANLPADQLPNFIGELAKVNALALSRLSTPAQVPARKADELLSTEEAARRLGISKTTLYHRDFPFTVRDPLTRRLRFSANGIEEWIAKQTNNRR